LIVGSNRAPLKIQDLLHHRIQESNADPAYEDFRYSGFVGSRSGGRMPVPNPDFVGP